MKLIDPYYYDNELLVYIDKKDVGDIADLTKFVKVTEENQFINTGREKYTPAELFGIGKVLLNRNPPDPFVAVNKVWMGLIFTIKKKCLRALDLDVCSHCSHTVLCRFLIEEGTENDGERNKYQDTFTDAEKLHQQHCGTMNFKQNELPNIFKQVEELAEFIERVDETNLWNKFLSTNLSYKKCVGREVDLAGYIIKCNRYVKYTTTTPAPKKIKK